MTVEQIFVIAVLLVPLALVFLDKLREDVAALLMACLLGLAQVLGWGVLGPANTPAAAAKAIEGFGSPEIITLISLFVVTHALDKYGLTRWLAEKMLKLGGRSEQRLIALFAVSGALLSLFMNTLAAGALLLPSALDAARRTGVKPSKLLIPVAYGTMLGGAATYLTTANIIISGLLPLAQPPQPALSFFAFTPTGGLVALAGLAFLIVFGSRLLPNREPPATDTARNREDLSRAYQLYERLWDVEVGPQAKVTGKTLRESAVGVALGVTVLGIRRNRQTLPAYLSDTRIQLGDVLIVVGREDRVTQLEQEGLWVRPNMQADRIDAGNAMMVEVIVPPRSGVAHKTLRELAFQSHTGFNAVALWRDQRSYRTDVAGFALQQGDSLLLVGDRARLGELKKQQDFVVLAAAPASAGSASESDDLDVPKATATLILVGLALAAMFAGLRVELATLSAMVGLLLLGLLSPEEAYGAVRWRAIFLIAGTLSVSQAMVQTGLAALVGGAVVNLAAPWGPLGLVAGSYVLSAVLTQLMGGQISPLVVGPIAISAAIRLGVNPQAIAVVTAIAGSVSFITPLSHPVNVLMIAPANYKFSDFVKSGWVLTVICFIALMLAMPLFWRL